MGDHEIVQFLVQGVVRVDNDPVRRPMPLILCYERDYPFEVTVTFPPAKSSPVSWLLTRDLLNDGRLGLQSIVGDLAVTPANDPVLGDAVQLRLTSPAGKAALWLPERDVTAFLAATYALVPAGTETQLVDWDAAIAALIGGASR